MATFNLIYCLRNTVNWNVYVGQTWRRKLSARADKNGVGYRGQTRLGILKPNSGTFGHGREAPLKGRRRVIIDGKVRYIPKLKLVG